MAKTAVSMSRDTNPLHNPVELTAAITAVTNKTTFMFSVEDCVARYVDEERDKLHPDGYDEVRDDKYGSRHTDGSFVAGMFFGMTEVVIYPEQFGIPCEKGLHFRFLVRPDDFINGCVRAVAEALCPPDYVI